MVEDHDLATLQLNVLWLVFLRDQYALFMCLAFQPQLIEVT